MSLKFDRVRDIPFNVRKAGIDFSLRTPVRNVNQADVVKNTQGTNDYGNIFYVLKPNSLCTEPEFRLLRGARDTLLLEKQQLWQSGEPKSSDHMTVTHQMLASTFLVFCTLSLSRAEKKFWKNFSLQAFIPKTRNILFLIYLASKGKRIPFRRLTRKWGEI